MVRIEIEFSNRDEVISALEAALEVAKDPDNLDPGIVVFEGEGLQVKSHNLPKSVNVNQQLGNVTGGTVIGAKFDIL